MKNAWQVIKDSYTGYASYLWDQIIHPGWHNYFYWLLGLSAFFFILEILRPWRAEQPKFRKDFWLDFFYMFFNYFLFSLLIFYAISNLLGGVVESALESWSFLKATQEFFLGLPVVIHLIIGFILADFIQWNTHRLLHRVPFLWEFHKVHHSVKQMGFAAHLRYHWIENVVYKSIQFIPLLFIGYSYRDFFVIHILATAIGHYNHANFYLSRTAKGFWGTLIIASLLIFGLDVHVFQGDQIGIEQPFLQIVLAFAEIFIFSAVLAKPMGNVMDVLFNSPEMHIWHHSKELPKNHKYGINFGLTLAIWDYVFGTAYIPRSGRDIELGFPGDEEFPDKFIGQQMHGIIPEK